MKAAIYLEDTTDGIEIRMETEGNGVTDHPESSLTIHLVAFFVQHVQQLSDVGVLSSVMEGV